MSTVQVVYYREADGSVPALDFIKTQPKRPAVKLLKLITRLEELGHEMRRPESDYLRDDIYELRVGFGHVNYRILYFFHGTKIAVLAGGLTKEDRVPPREINIAIERKTKYEKDSIEHSWTEE